MSETTISLRKATGEDLHAIVSLLADDELGQGREDASLPLSQDYMNAFNAIEADGNQLLTVAVCDGHVVGTMQVSFLPGLSRRGMWRGQIEAVRIAASQRGSGLGQRMIEWAIDQCRTRDCKLVQLATDKSRPKAHRFYEKLGFKASHEGYKLLF